MTANARFQDEAWIYELLRTAIDNRMSGGRYRYNDPENFARSVARKVAEARCGDFNAVVDLAEPYLVEAEQKVA